MAVDEHDELPEATQREAKLQRQIDDLQGQVTRLHRTREETNPELSSEFQILKEKLDEHSKQLEQSAEKLSQLESENLTLREENQALNAASNKKRRFRTQVRPMPTLETPNSGAGANLPTTAPGGDASTLEKAMDAQTYDVEDIDSEPEPDKEASDGATRAESPMIAHLYQMFSDRLDAMQPARDSGNRNWGRYQNRPIEKAKGMAVSTWPDISHLSVSRPELVNVLRQMGQQVKWPQKMKAPDSFWNPGFWCDFHLDHSHKTEDCVALKIEDNELLRKGHLREFLSEKATSHLSKDTAGKPTEVAPISPPRQDRVIHVISGGSEISGISHAAAKKSTWNAMHGLEAAMNRRDKLHGQGAEESYHSASRRPGYFAHYSELPGKTDTDR
ncbi:hypothetical protein F2Q69_00014137 [Brassica cretica]|uniref:Uncharacterized protein n=1 Tax=Brassica cretica TaxID=69181 RepID=A0A8S9QKM1_BRACR|nr:hypothetical protein F2Q69_00014137 [Brassica cretica]